MGREEVSSRCSAVEEAYEFMLAYAGQGLSGKEHSQACGQVREFLNRAAEALTGLAEDYSGAVRDENLQPSDRYMAFLTVLEKDALDSLASIHLVLAQSTISSQLIDNLNASIHLRALLTDLFLIDEIFKPQPVAERPAITS
jgi:hypothetical protein